MSYTITETSVELIEENYGMTDDGYHGMVRNEIFIDRSEAIELALDLVEKYDLYEILKKRRDLKAKG